MADISLLFDVAGGGSIEREGSGKEIAKQLGAIVNEINKKPYGIKFEADKTSLDTFRDQIKEITSSLGSVKIDGLDFKSMIGDISSISRSLSNVPDLFARVAGAAGMSASKIKTMSRELGGIKDLINEINNKEFNVTNIIDSGHGVDVTKERLELYKDKAYELYTVLGRVYDAMQLVSKHQPAAYNQLMTDTNLRGSISRYADLMAIFEKTIKNGSISDITHVMSQMESILTQFTKAFDVAATKGLPQYTPDMSGFDAASARLQEFEDRIRRVDDAQEKLLTGASKESEAFNEKLNNVSGADEYTKQFKAAIESIDSDLSSLRQKILETFDLTNVPVDTTNIKTAIENLKAELDGIEIKITGEPQESGGGKPTRKRSSNKRASKDAVLDEKERLKILKDIEKEYQEIAKLTSKNEATKSRFGDIAQEMGEVRTCFMEGKISVEEYDGKIVDLLHRFGLLKAKIAEVDAVAEGANVDPGESSKLVEGTKGFEDRAAKISRLINRINNDLKKFTAAKNGASSNYYRMLENDIEDAIKLRAALDSGTISAEEFDERLSRLGHRVTSSETAIRGAGEATKTWYEHVGKLTEKFAEWFSVARVMSAIYRKLMQMFTAVREIDKAMTELRKVTDATDTAYDRFLTNATKRAQKLGGSLSDVVSASADFARLGFTLEDSEKLADAAIVYKNVGDGIDDINVASESIIATMQAFGITAEEVMTIVDKFNDVGNKFAISSSGVGEALLRSAAAMKAANNTLDETIALATAANTIVQNPETVGR